MDYSREFLTELAKMMEVAGIVRLESNRLKSLVIAVSTFIKYYFSAFLIIVLTEDSTETSKISDIFGRQKCLP